ncbi:DUF3016 domain-containing protein, partial [Aquabacterium sp.]|uniref:DUF3016 domain-containing protein n=1 Tax=Aquabacterium sp. TaxID=1872578 RepID=UPI002C549EEC
LILLACLASTAAAAGTVEVKFTKPETFTDVRDNMMRRDEVLATFADRLKQLAAKGLPAGQTLQVEVLDIDLAGEIWPRSARDVRVLRGRADWPRMQLRYTLREGDRVVRSGEDQLSDMNYMMSSLQFSSSGPYAYDMRMLDNWFRERFNPPKQ